MAACGLHQSRRLHFAPLLKDVEEHLRRTATASLLVDTPEYNSHTTGSDGLWAGVPMLSVAGEPMAARVGGSLLSASAGTSGLVHSLKEYADQGFALVSGAGRGM